MALPTPAHTPKQLSVTSGLDRVPHQPELSASGHDAEITKLRAELAALKAEKLDLQSTLITSAGQGLKAESAAAQHANNAMSGPRNSSEFDARHCEHTR